MSALLPCVITVFLITEAVYARRVTYLVKQDVQYRDGEGSLYNQARYNAKHLKKVINGVKPGSVESVHIDKVLDLNKETGVARTAYKVAVGDVRYTPYWLVELYTQGKPDGVPLEVEFQGKTVYEKYGDLGFIFFSSYLAKNTYWHASDVCRFKAARLLNNELVLSDSWKAVSAKLVNLTRFSRLWVSDWEIDDQNRTADACTLYTPGKMLRNDSCARGHDAVCVKNLTECYPEFAEACGEEEVCRVTEEYFVCECLDGFRRKLGVCEDVDECSSGKSKCHAMAECRNTVGSYTCSCSPGFIGDERECKKPVVDIWAVEEVTLADYEELQTSMPRSSATLFASTEARMEKDFRISKDATTISNHVSAAEKEIGKQETRPRKVRRVSTALPYKASQINWSSSTSDNIYTTDITASTDGTRGQRRIDSDYVDLPSALDNHAINSFHRFGKLIDSDKKFARPKSMPAKKSKTFVALDNRTINSFHRFEKLIDSDKKFARPTSMPAKKLKTIGVTFTSVISSSNLKEFAELFVNAGRESGGVQLDEQNEVLKEGYHQTLRPTSMATTERTTPKLQRIMTTDQALRPFMRRLEDGQKEVQKKSYHRTITPTGMATTQRTTPKLQRIMSAATYVVKHTFSHEKFTNYTMKEMLREADDNGSRFLMKTFDDMKPGIVRSVVFNQDLSVEKGYATYKVVVADGRYTPFWLQDLYKESMKRGHVHCKEGDLLPEFKEKRRTKRLLDHLFTSFSSIEDTITYWYALDLCKSIAARVVTDKLMRGNFNEIAKALFLGRHTKVWIKDWDNDDVNRTGHMCMSYRNDGTRLIPRKCDRGGIDAVCVKHRRECYPEFTKACNEREVCHPTEESDQPGYVCNCKSGFIRVWKGEEELCEDVNECKSTWTNQCHQLAECHNTVGSYNCSCRSGYEGDGFVCKNLVRLRQHFKIPLSSYTPPADPGPPEWETKTSDRLREMAAAAFKETESVRNVTIDYVFPDGKDGVFTSLTLDVTWDADPRKIAAKYKDAHAGHLEINVLRPHPGKIVIKRHLRNSEAGVDTHPDPRKMETNGVVSGGKHGKVLEEKLFTMKSENPVVGEAGEAWNQSVRNFVKNDMAAILQGVNVTNISFYHIEVNAEGGFSAALNIRLGSGSNPEEVRRDYFDNATGIWGIRTSACTDCIEVIKRFMIGDGLDLNSERFKQKAESFAEEWLSRAVHLAGIQSKLANQSILLDGRGGFVVEMKFPITEEINKSHLSQIFNDTAAITETSGFIHLKQSYTLTLPWNPASPSWDTTLTPRSPAWETYVEDQILRKAKEDFRMSMKVDNITETVVLKNGSVKFSAQLAISPDTSGHAGAIALQREFQAPMWSSPSNLSSTYWREKAHNFAKDEAERVFSHHPLDEVIVDDVILDINGSYLFKMQLKFSDNFDYSQISSNSSYDAEITVTPDSILYAKRFEVSELIGGNGANFLDPVREEADIFKAIRTFLPDAVVRNASTVIDENGGFFANIEIHVGKNANVSQVSKLLNDTAVVSASLDTGVVHIKQYYIPTGSAGDLMWKTALTPLSPAWSLKASEYVRNKTAEEFDEDIVISINTTAVESGISDKVPAAVMILIEPDPVPSWPGIPTQSLGAEWKTRASEFAVSRTLKEFETIANVSDVSITYITPDGDGGFYVSMDIRIVDHSPASIVVENYRKHNDPVMIDELETDLLRLRKHIKSVDIPRTPAAGSIEFQKKALKAARKSIYESMDRIIPVDAINITRLVLDENGGFFVDADITIHDEINSSHIDQFYNSDNKNNTATVTGSSNPKKLSIRQSYEPSVTKDPFDDSIPPWAEGLTEGSPAWKEKAAEYALENAMKTMNNSDQIFNITIDDILPDGNGGFYAVLTIATEKPLEDEDLTGEDRKPVDANCLQQKLRSQSNSSVEYLFPEAEVNETVDSFENCSYTGAPLASINCTLVDDLPTFSLASMREHDCVEWGPDSLEIEDKVKHLQSLTSNTSVSVDELVDSLAYIAQLTANRSTKVSYKTIESAVSITDRVGKMKKNSTSDTQENKAFEIVKALETLSEYVPVKQHETLIVPSETLKLQISIPDDNEPAVFNNAPVQSESDPSAKTRTRRDTSSGLENATSISVSLDTTKFKVALSKVIFIAFAGTELYPSGDQKYRPEKVLSVKVTNQNIKAIADVIKYNMTPHVSSKKEMVHYFRCGYLEEETNSWLFDGCETFGKNNIIECKCNHLTNFAVLVQTKAIPRIVALDIFGTVGCSLSVCGLVLTIIILASNIKLRSKMSTKLHLHLGTSLLVGYSAFLAGIERSQRCIPYYPCIAVAAVIHYALLCSWGWMAVECYTMYKKFVTVLYHPHKRFLINACILVYGISAAISATTAGFFVGKKDAELQWTPVEESCETIKPSTYVGDQFCWLHGEALYYGFLAPVGLVFLINSTASMFILKSITCCQKRIQSSSPAADILTRLTRVFTISILLGMSWIFAAFLAVFDDVVVQSVFGWLFTITNSLKGFIIFLLFCVRYKEVRDGWWPQVRALFCKVVDSKEESHSGISTLNKIKLAAKLPGNRMFTINDSLGHYVRDPTSSSAYKSSSDTHETFTSLHQSEFSTSVDSAIPEKIPYYQQVVTENEYSNMAPNMSYYQPVCVEECSDSVLERSDLYEPVEFGDTEEPENTIKHRAKLICKR